jgi:glycine/D-amino acid oxidase-like deaminating enzyme
MFAPSPSTPAPRHLDALREVAPTPYWLEHPDRPEARSALIGAEETDLLVVGGGFTGLWTALLAKEEDPERDVVLLEADRIGHAATGRNGGFVAASLTHGFLNGLDRFPEELDTLDRLGQENLDQIEATIARYGIACDWRRSGGLDVAVAPWQAQDLAEAAELMREHGHDVELLDGEQTRARVNSPTYVAGLLDARSVALVDPARLAWGLARACEAAGVRIFEGTPADDLSSGPTAVRVTTPFGSVEARRVALATNAFRPLLRRISAYIVPVYDYVLMTEPLSAAQKAAIGWANGEGIGDAGNQFHYYRMSDDDRILWGGYDAVYYFGSKVRAEYDQRPETFAALADHFFATFPQLEGLRFTHAWGGAIDTCSRFSAFWGTAHGDRVAYVAGYTGLGVGATRFGARVMLDLLDGRDTERTRLRMVRTKPLPFPPEPLRFAGIELTRRSIAAADRHDGRRNLWLRTLDRAGLGFDS